MNMKTMLCVATATLSSAVMASDTPEVSNVVMTQSEYGRRVTITYDLNNAASGAVVTLDIETNKTGSATNVDSDWVSIGGAAVCNAQGDVWKKVSQGSNKTITWRPDLSWEGHKIELANGGARAVVTAWALDNTPDYMVVDLTASGGPDTQRYYSSTNFLPGGLLANEDYRKNLLVMRKIMAKDVRWTMGTLANTGASAGHVVQLTNNYYIGVFEFTQSQWAKVATNSATKAYYSTDKLMRPMERVTFNELRNTHRTSAMTDTLTSTDSGITAGSGGVWPAAPTSDSFLGLLRLKTGLDFDLPSEAEWEFACRAGHGEEYWGNGEPYAPTSSSTDLNLDHLGRYRRANNPTGGDGQTPTLEPAQGGSNIVGSYAPNSWGLYDMHGNVGETCLDWYSADAAVMAELNGKVNTTAATHKVVRGGRHNAEVYDCKPAARGQITAAGVRYHVGFRVVCRAGLD